MEDEKEVEPETGRKRDGKAVRQKRTERWRQARVKKTKIH